MTVYVAKNKTELKKRMRRFFSKDSSRQKVLQELSPLFTGGEVLAFGGVVRDIALYGGKLFSSDLDLIYTGEKEHFHRSLEGKGIINKFGGYRLKAGGWDTDIWHVEDTWAFKSRKVHYKNELSLLGTTITNWDAVLYSISKNRVYCHKNYFKDLSSGYIDLVLEENPNTFGAMVRILRCFVLKEASQFSPSIITFLNTCFERYSDAEIIEHESASYKKRYLNQEVCGYMRRMAKANAGSFLPLMLDRFYMTKDMFGKAHH